MDHGFTNDYADKYYAIIRAKERKSYVKNHIAIDIKTLLILNYATQRGPRSDTKFAINSIKQTKKNIIHIYILTDMSIRHRTHKKMYKRIHRSFRP